MCFSRRSVQGLLGSCKQQMYTTVFMALFFSLKTELFTKTNTCNHWRSLSSNLVFEKVTQKGIKVPTYNQIFSVLLLDHINNSLQLTAVLYEHIGVNPLARVRAYVLFFHWPCLSIAYLHPPTSSESNMFEDLVIVLRLHIELSLESLQAISPYTNERVDADFPSRAEALKP